MKIGLVLEDFDFRKGGLEHWTWQFAEQLVKHRHDVHVVAFTFHPESEELGVQRHQLPMPDSRLDRAAASEAKLKTLNLDVIHDMGTGWYADIFHPHGGSTLAHFEHNLMRIPRWRRFTLWREKRYRERRKIEIAQHRNKTSLIVAVSEMVKRHFETKHQHPASRIRVIPNGVDEKRFCPEACTPHREAMRNELQLEDSVMFLMLAHNLPLKNAAGLVEAIALLRAKGITAKLVIAGSRKRRRTERLVEKRGVGDLVTLLGPVDDPIPYFAAADVYVQPTWYDPCSLVTLEAWGCGLPVISTRYNGTSAWVTEGQEGFVLDEPGDVPALASAMEACLDPKKRSQMGNAGRALALEHTFDRQTRQFLDLYEEVVAAKQKQAASSRL